MQGLFSFDHKFKAQKQNPESLKKGNGSIVNWAFNFIICFNNWVGDPNLYIWWLLMVLLFAAYQFIPFYGFGKHIYIYTTGWFCFDTLLYIGMTFSYIYAYIYICIYIYAYIYMAYSETTRIRNGNDNRTCPGSLWEAGIKHMQSKIELSQELTTQDMQEILYIWNVFRTTSLSYIFELVSLFLPQPRLCILALLCTKIRFLATYAIKCASWTAVNRGTSGRSACASIGHEGFASVDNSNTMASRNLWFTTIWLTIFFHVCEWGSSMQWFIVQYIYVGLCGNHKPNGFVNNLFHYFAVKDLPTLFVDNGIGGNMGSGATRAISARVLSTFPCTISCFVQSLWWNRCTWSVIRNLYFYYLSCRNGWFPDR